MSKPKIRFKGYEEDWEQRKLGDIAEFSKGSGYSKGDLIESGTPIILYGRLYTKYETSISEVDTYVEAKDGSVYSKGGEVIVPASGETAEDIARAATVDKSGVILGGDLNVVSPNEDINSAFLAISISHGNSQRELAKKAQGKSIVHIHNEEIKNLVVPFPTKAEQNKIVEYFSSLDNLITLHQRKCEETKKLKKYMLQKMFPQNGKRVPEIRFVGFTEDWEQRKLSDITLKIGSGKTPSGGKNAYVDDGIPLIRSQNINNDRVDLEDIVFIDEETDNSMENSRVFTDDVLLNITGASIGRSAVYRGKDKANVNQHVCIIRPTKDFDSDFIQLNLASNFGQKQIDASQAGGGREGLNFQEIGKMSFMFPSNQEQMKIGVYFNHIDYLITLHQRKYEELQKIKKFMLQNMFI
ncbi:restriction endonuclease subunit S [Anaerostipes hadrus]|uniref:restriction endonuclease subunit S n=1 Tax=Anaerostipes hadrus TaxID=649756 RepID=UPI00156DDCD3|nr:restriction endonuclease subunit S [Anaerostipes hadrus]NSH03932.1 restriction endonuclease subunit S [Anaerostipes hadrus]